MGILTMDELSGLGQRYGTIAQAATASSRGAASVARSIGRAQARVHRSQQAQAQMQAQAARAQARARVPDPGTYAASAARGRHIPTGLMAEMTASDILFPSRAPAWSHSDAVRAALQAGQFVVGTPSGSRAQRVVPTTPAGIVSPTWVDPGSSTVMSIPGYGQPVSY
jgi:hypothetical protein